MSVKLCKIGEIKGGEAGYVIKINKGIYNKFIAESGM